MRRWSMAFLAALVALWFGAAAALADAPPPAPRGWALVDADTGAVIDGGQARTPMLVASVFKILTAIVVQENLAAGSDVPVSARAEGMPARKINLKAGQVWKSDDLLAALLLVSANDAAVALAEKTAGSLEAFAGMLDRTAQRLGMGDQPVLRDPAGLDDEFSVMGGNLISPRDMAIAARAFLSYPALAGIVTQPVYRFHGGDGANHRLLNHNLLLRTYAGAVGVKTGYTRRAGHSLVGAATRDGRTMIAVVVNAADSYRSAAALLDQGFTTPVAAEAGLDHLPPIAQGDARDPVTSAAPAPRAVSTPSPADHRPKRTASGAAAPLAVLFLGGAPAVYLLATRPRPTPAFPST